MSEDDNSMTQNRSMLKDFLASIATMSGDLSNITAPPFVLDTKSVVEIPTFWAENPSIFVSPAQQADPVQRALMVLRSFLAGMRSQCYMGHRPEAGVKKPLNAFLGELFIGKWEEDDNGTTHVVSEQVSHHPPITACRVWNDKYGVIAEGYNRQTVTFNGSVHVQCSGHILKTLTKYDNEHYLIPIPDFKVKGILGTPYPELSDTYRIPSTTGYTSIIHFSGKGWFSSSSKKHGFTAHLYKESEGESRPLFTIQGQWDSEYTIHDNTQNKDVEVFNVEEHALKNVPQLILDPLDEQDPWESRRAWHDTVEALKRGDMKGVNDAKSKLEEGQREMRKDEERAGKDWETLFFKSSTTDDVVLKKLMAKDPDEDFAESKKETEGVWKFDVDAWKKAKKPYRGELRPDNTTTMMTGKKDGLEARHEEKKEDQFQSRSESGEKHAESKPDEGVDVVQTTDKTESVMAMKQSPSTKIERPSSTRQDEEITTGIEDMSIEEKEQIENMLRDQYSTAKRHGHKAKA